MQAGVDIENFSYAAISHSDSMEDAMLLADMVEQEFHPKRILIGDIGPVIGAHTGPGALVLTYFGKEEKGI